VKKYLKRSAEWVTALKQDPFKWARLKLTAFFVIVIVSSLVFYLFLQYREFNRHIINFAQNNIQDPDRRNRFIARSIIVEKETLFTVAPEDVGMFILTIIISYFMADITLRPIKKSMETQKQFLANASHELHTPLAIIKTELEVFLRNKNNKRKGYLLRKRTEVLSNLEELEKMQQILDNLLFLSRQDSYEESFHFAKINLSSLLSEVLERISEVAKRKKISFYLKKSDNVNISADYNRLEQAFLNIITNAIKYTNPGGKISIVTDKNDHYVSVSITDNGIGISNDALPHIFERFYRDRSVGINRAKGVGLGLYIASMVIKKHGGKIEVKSTLGKGTTVRITLPLKPSS